MGSKSDYYENKILDHTLRDDAFTAPSAVYSALFTVIPSDSSGGTEVTNSTSGYTRVVTTFVTAGLTSDGRTSNASAVSFVTLAGGATLTIVGWAIMDTSTVAAGNVLYWSTVTSTVLEVGDQATFPAANIVITED